METIKEKMKKNVFKILLILATIIIYVKVDVYSQHYNIDTSSYIEGNDILSEFDIEYMSDYEKWSEYFGELSKYLKPEYIDVWNDVEGVDFYYVYRRTPQGIEGLGVNEDSLINGNFGYFGVLHNAQPYYWYTPSVYRFKNLIDKLKGSEKKLRYRRIFSKIVMKPISVIVDNIKIVLNYVKRKLYEIKIHKFETMEFGLDKHEKPLQWLVLDKNEKNQEYLLLLREQFDGIHEDANDNITWDQCHVREFLNCEFYENYFSDAEKSRIISIEFFDEELNEKINDKVFILSNDEVKKYLYNEKNKAYDFDCFTTNNWNEDDAILEYSYYNKLCKRHRKDIFTIRDYGYMKKTFSSIDIDGNIYPFETHIRPAMWVKYK